MRIFSIIPSRDCSTAWLCISLVASTYTAAPVFFVSNKRQPLVRMLRRALKMLSYLEHRNVESLASLWK